MKTPPDVRTPATLARGGAGGGIRPALRGPEVTYLQGWFVFPGSSPFSGGGGVV